MGVVHKTALRRESSTEYDPPGARVSATVDYTKKSYYEQERPVNEGSDHRK
jgi:hypothetical protein